ncbi:hypothetical protein E308F_27790 [Moorella sp. E308F]|uniref:hypothetical protein n=1 Tax=Moorella sp. E308F TaxID=2572682 RepID=UPI0010FFC110|nr:hypothetical protein [Moorella sp. E308F]GEA16533.1 hypothetical protein E308F_27790 [Moorella sp. E308F]
MDIFSMPLVFIGILICHKYKYNNLYRYATRFFILLAVSQIFILAPSLLYSTELSLKTTLFIMNVFRYSGYILIIIAYIMLVLGFWCYKNNRGDKS